MEFPTNRSFPVTSLDGPKNFCFTSRFVTSTGPEMTGLFFEKVILKDYAFKGHKNIPGDIVWGIRNPESSTVDQQWIAN